MLWLKLYPPGEKEGHEQGTFLELEILRPTTLRIHVNKPTRHDVLVGLDADKRVVKAVRSDAINRSEV